MKVFSTGELTNGDDMSDESLKRMALKYHRQPVPGKLEIAATKPLGNQRDLALAYSPGVAAACEAIVEDVEEAATLTGRQNSMPAPGLTPSKRIPSTVYPVDCAKERQKKSWMLDSHYVVSR